MTPPTTKPSQPAVHMPMTRSLSANRLASISGALATAQDPQKPKARTATVDATRIGPALDIPHMVLKPSRTFTDAMKKDDLRRLLDNPPSLRGEATSFSDGRNVKVVIALVRDVVGNTRAGVLVQLRQKKDNSLLDHTRTNEGGVAILRFPLKESFEGKIPAAVVEVLGPDIHEILDVTPKDGSQFALAEIAVPEVPLVDGAEPGDPFTRIPIDFTPELCDEVSRILGHWEDPLLKNLAAPGDFRTRRTPVVKRFTVPRIGPDKDEDGGPRRYLVHMRQEWMFLGYTLGELQEVDGLDPGQVMDESVRTLTRTTERLASSAVNNLSQGLREVQDTLSRVSSVDTLVDVASTLHTHTDAGASLRASGGGGYVGIPGLFGVGGGTASASTTAWLRNSVLANATTRTSTDTSLMVNSMVRAAQTQINRTVRTASNTLNSVSEQAMSSVGQVSPLLSRVTNLLRWTVYENYAVCTRVEDVVRLRAVKVVDESTAGDLFSAEDIAEYQPYFQDRLLNPGLGRHFAAIRRAVDLRNAAERPVTGVGFSVDYSAQHCGADLRITVAGEDIMIPLRPGGRTASGWIHLPTPVPQEDLEKAEMELVLRSDRYEAPRFPIGNWNLGDLLRESASVQVTRTRIRFASVPGANLNDTEAIDGFEVRHDRTTARVDVPLVVPEPHVFPETDPLYLHINRNPTYYMGLLLQAALDTPSLRDDAPQLRGLFPGHHEIWRLPIVGFEGDRILVIGDADPKDSFARKLREDVGAGTLVQLAAPGAYSEALQGLLQLTDAAGKIHPGLQPPLPPHMPPLAVVDLAGRTLQVVEGGNGAVQSVASAAEGATGGAPSESGGGVSTVGVGH